MAQGTEPLLGPLPDSVYPVGWPIGSSEGHGTDYETQELLHKPHAFALMHGDKGAKIAFGQLHWRVDCFKMKFKSEALTVTVADHQQHRHAHVHTHEIPSHYHAQTGYLGSGYTAAGVLVADGTVAADRTGPAEPEDTDVCKAILLEADGTPDLDGDGQYQDATGSDEGNHNKHTVTYPTITYCYQSSQETMANMETTIPKYPTKDGEEMNPKWGDKKYHELDEYGTVYLVWQVDIEQPGSEVIHCWVQVGEPKETTTVSDISMASTATNRRNTNSPHDGTGEPEDGDDEVENDNKGIFYIELGTVMEDDHVEQRVSSDVNWTSTVMDRVVY